MNIELDIALCRRRGEIRLDYTLRAGDRERRFKSPAFIEDPNAFNERFFSIVERSLRGLGPAGEPALKEEISRRFRTYGQDLYHDLLPLDVRRDYWRLREDVTTLLIRSQEPWIPWEMLVPVDDDSKDSADHLASTCALTRWLMGSALPPRTLEPKPILFIQVAASDHGSVLTAAEGERTALAALARRLGVELVELDHPTVDEVEAAILESRPGIIHASAHGAFETAWPDQSALIVGGRRPFRPDDLAGDLRRTLRRDRPLVFFNACQLGRQGWSLTGLGGWARNLVESHSSAFLAPVWTVTDRLASLFAAVFYRRLGKGETLGAAALAARRATRAEEPDLPTWLAYQVYGHPAARLRPVAGAS